MPKPRVLVSINKDGTVTIEEKRRYFDCSFMKLFFKGLFTPKIDPAPPLSLDENDLQSFT